MLDKKKKKNPHRQVLSLAQFWVFQNFSDAVTNIAVK